MTARELSRRRVLETVPLICFGGCTAPRSSQRFAGHYSWGFEASVFAPCDRAERWWVVNDHELYNRYQTVAENDYEQVYAEVRGVLSERGAYGHGGEYPRQLEITDVRMVRVTRPDDC